MSRTIQRINRIFLYASGHATLIRKLKIWTFFNVVLNLSEGRYEQPYQPSFVLTQPACLLNKVFWTLRQNGTIVEVMSYYMLFGLGRVIPPFFQESTQTFGVISARIEIRDPYSGKSVVQRPSVSCTASSITYSSGEANRGVLTGTSKDIQGGAIGDEVEVSSFLVFDQHTFEGIIFLFIFI